MTEFNEGELTFSLPSNWKEITLGQFLAIRNLLKDGGAPDIFTQLSILSSVEREFFFHSEMPEERFEEFISAIAWMGEAPDYSTFTKPELYEIGNKALVIPDDLTLKTLGQKYAFETKVLPVSVVVEETPMCDIDVMDMAVAIYLQPLYTGEKFNLETIDETIEDMQDSSLQIHTGLQLFF